MRNEAAREVEGEEGEEGEGVRSSERAIRTQKHPESRQPVQVRMKTFLLVNPWIHDFAAFDFWLKPLGLMRIAALLREAGHEVVLLDMLDRNHPWLRVHSKTDSWGRGKFHSEEIEKPCVLERVPRRFKRYGIPKPAVRERLAEMPDADAVLLTSGMTYWYTGVRETVEVLKERYPETNFLLGGIYASLMPEHSKANAGVDHVIPGAMPGICEALGKALDVDLKWKDLPPLWELYATLDYAVMTTTEGCPMRCTYCGSQLLKKGFSARDPEAVCEEIDYLAGLGVRRIAFYDDALLFNPEFDDLMKRLAGMGLELHTPNGLHVTMMNAAKAQAMRRAGFRSLYLSLESVDESLLDSTGAKLTVGAFVKAVEHLKDAGFGADELHSYILFGLRNQSEDSVKRTVELALRLGVKPHLAEFSPVPGTQEYERSGLFFMDDPLLTNNTAWTSIQGMLESLERLKQSLKMKEF